METCNPLCAPAPLTERAKTKLRRFVVYENGVTSVPPWVQVIVACQVAEP